MCVVLVRRSENCFERVIWQLAIRAFVRLVNHEKMKKEGRFDHSSTPSLTL